MHSHWQEELEQYRQIIAALQQQISGGTPIHAQARGHSAVSDHVSLRRRRPLRSAPQQSVLLSNQTDQHIVLLETL